MNLNLYMIFLLVLFKSINSISLTIKSKIRNMLVDKFIPEINMTIDQIITNKGYHLQIHFTTTSDGYVLKMYRILPKKLSKNKVVLLQHGLFVFIF